MIPRRCTVGDPHGRTDLVFVSLHFIRQHIPTCHAVVRRRRVISNLRFLSVLLFKFLSGCGRALYNAFLRAARIPRGLNREDVLRNLRLLADDGLCNAGVLLFAKDPARFFQQAVVVCAVFRGLGKTKIIDKRTVGGTLVDCYEGAMAYLREHLNTEYVIRSGPRQEILELPEEALREAILNALAHRDYRLTDAIQIHIFYDRVEMLNPGGLVPGLKIKDLGHVSRPRNPLLFGIMDRMELVENVGSGIKRIRDAMFDYGLRPPVIRSAETWFSLIFRRKGANESIENLSRKPIGEPIGPGSSKGSPNAGERIVALINQNPRVSGKDLAEHLGISDRAVRKHLSRLQAEGLVKRIGPDRGGSWKTEKAGAEKVSRNVPRKGS